MLDQLRRATHPMRKRLAAFIYTPPSLPPEIAAVSYSGWGEDVLAMSWLQCGGIQPSSVRSLDIGAAEPRRLSNTYLFYSRGARGVLVEPDPDQASLLRAT